MKKVDFTKRPRIRLAMVHCDTHAYYYGAHLSPCDALLMRKHCNWVHRYFYNMYAVTKLQITKVPGFEISRAWDRDAAAARRYAETFHSRPKVCRSLEEAAEAVDAAFIAECSGGGETHLELAAPFLRRGLPAFVDKPIAATLKDAQVIFALARKHRAPVISASLLSYLPAAEQFRRRFAELGGIGLGVVKGVGGGAGLAGIIHGIALALNLFGPGVQWVQCTGQLPLQYLVLHYPNRFEALVINSADDVFPDSCSFSCEVFSRRGPVQFGRPASIHSPPMGDPEFLAGAPRILALFKKTVLTRKAAIPEATVLEPIAIIEAGRKAQASGKAVAVARHGSEFSGSHPCREWQAGVQG